MVDFTEVEMKKRIFVLLFCMLLALSLAGCSRGAEEKSSSDTSSSDEQISDSDYLDMSVSEWKERAQNGDAMAMYRLGVYYDYSASKDTQDDALAMKWYQKAADAGLVKAETALGYLYLHGCGTEPSEETAVSFFQKAAAGGDPNGTAGLARTVFEETAPSADALTGAYQNLVAARDAGSEDAVYLLGYASEKGLGCEQNYDAALLYYTQASGFDTRDPVSAYNVNSALVRLGVIWSNGLGVTADYAKAIDYFKQAADADFAPAEYYLGVMYQEGYGTDADDGEAFSWFSKAAGHSYAPAQNQIGYFYYNGLGTDVDYDQAVYYLKLSAASGYAPAQINLGYLYENGYGVEQNLSSALAYYQMAEASGYAGASEAVSRVSGKMQQTT